LIPEKLIYFTNVSFVIRFIGNNQCFGSGFGFNQVSGSGSGSGSRRAKMTHKNRKKVRNFMF
jgi:hypothetical protein